MFHTRARAVSKSKNKAHALWYLAPIRDFSRPSIMTFPERSHTRHSQSLRFLLIATSKGARSSIRGCRPGNTDTVEGMTAPQAQTATGGF
jgi:hypothetical protein